MASAGGEFFASEAVSRRPRVWWRPADTRTWRLFQELLIIPFTQDVIEEGRALIRHTTLSPTSINPQTFYDFMLIKFLILPSFLFFNQAFQFIIR